MPAGRAAPERPVLNVSKDDPKRTFSHRPFKTDWSLPARAKAPETGHREGRSWVDFGRKPGGTKCQTLTTRRRHKSLLRNPEPLWWLTRQGQSGIAKIRRGS